MRKNAIGLIILGVFIVIQFIRPGRSVPAVDPAQDIRQVLQPPAEVSSLLKDACYDCHSYETKYPWYSQIAPVSWWLANHINEGREQANFSTFGALSAEDRAEVLEEAAEYVGNGEMPLDSYTWMHPEAKLNDGQRKLLVDWFNGAGGEGAQEVGAQGNEPEAGEED